MDDRIMFFSCVRGFQGVADATRQGKKTGAFAASSPVPAVAAVIGDGMEWVSTSFLYNILNKQYV
jgi:hypothetical protein